MPFSERFAQIDVDKECRHFFMPEHTLHDLRNVDKHIQLSLRYNKPADLEVTINHALQLLTFTGLSIEKIFELTTGALADLQVEVSPEQAEQLKKKIELNELWFKYSNQLILLEAKIKSDLTDSHKDISQEELNEMVKEIFMMQFS